MQGHACEPQEVSERSGSCKETLARSIRASLECGRKGKSSLLIEGVLCDRVTEEKELLV